MRLQGRESHLGHKREDHRFKAGPDGFEPQDDIIKAIWPISWSNLFPLQ